MKPIQTPSLKVVSLWGRRAGLVAVEILLVVAVLVGLGVGLLLWRLHTGPIDLKFAQDYIQSALHNPDRKIYVTMGRVLLHWPDMRGPMLLGLRDVRIVDDNKNKVIASVAEADLELSMAGLLIGRVSPVSVSLKRPALRIIRSVEGDFDISFAADGYKTADDADDRELVDRILQYIAHPGSENDASPLASLSAFHVEGARVVIEDHMLGVTWFLPRMDAAIKSTQQGLEAALNVQFPGRKGSVSDVRANMLFDWAKKDVAMVAEAQGLDARMLAGKISELSILRDQDFVFDAQVEATLGPDFKPRAARIHVASPRGSVRFSDLSDKPVDFGDIALDAIYDGTSKTLKLQQARVTAGDITLQAEGELKHTDTTMDGSAKVSINELRQEQIGPLWPAALKGDSSEEWVVKRLSDGIFRDVFATIKFNGVKGAEGWSYDAKDIKAGFEFEGMSADYRPPMLPVKQAKGLGTFDYATETLKMVIESATIGDLAVNEATLEFVDIIKVGAGKADVNVKIAGPLKTAIEYVSVEPISLKHPFDMKGVKGTMNAAVNVKFPTTADIKIADVKVAVEGSAKDVALPNVVKGLELTGGPMNLAVKGDEFNVKGGGQLAGRPVNFEYKEFLSSEGKPYKNKVAAALAVDAELREYFGVDLSEFIEGSADVQLIYTEYEGGRAEADIDADLTKARVFSDPFDYEKKPGEAGNAKLKAILQNGVPKQVKGLVATAPKLKIDSTDLFFAEHNKEVYLSQGKVSHFAIGETVGSSEFTIDAAGAMTVALNSQFLDLRPFLDNEEQKTVYDDPPMKISVAADTMRMAEGESVQYGKIYVDIDKEGRFNQLEMDATAGSGDIYLRFKPDASGKRVFRFEADDAGATLKAFGLYNNVHGGTLTAYAEPIKGVFDRNLVGTVEMQNFKVVKAPALARLLGALSLPGLMNLLGDEGITFTKMEAKFNWLYRPDGSMMVLKDGRTSGNSLGLTFEGTFDKAEGNVDLSGTLVPLSGVNEIIGSIPLIGDILTGGSGGVFAATYTIKGKAEQPEIFVNPLSILTPGILRTILFE